MVMSMCRYHCITRMHKSIFNTLRPRQNGRHFADDTFKRIFLKENVRISIEISLNFVPRSPIDTIPALFQIMAWRRPGDKPLSEAMMVSLLTYICVARPQWVKSLSFVNLSNNWSKLEFFLLEICREVIKSFLSYSHHDVNQFVCA